MAFENLGKCVPLPAGADLSASQYCFVDVNTSGQAVVASDGDNAVGVLQNDPAAAGREATVMIGNGITKVKTGAVTTAGGPVGCDASGRAVDAASGDYILGKFLEASGGANQIVSIIFRPEPAKL